MNQIINVNAISVEFHPCNPHNFYLQWEHIAIWHHIFNLQLMMREAIEDLNNKEGFNNG